MNTEIDDANDQDEWDREFLDLESSLTFHQLRVLMAAANPEDGLGIYEPLSAYLVNPEEFESIHPLTLLVTLTESTLLEMAQARKLVRIGLIELDRELSAWRITTKGSAALRWYLGSLIDEWPRLDGIDVPPEVIDPEDAAAGDVMYSAEEIAEALGVSVEEVHRRATAEGWPCRWVSDDRAKPILTVYSNPGAKP